MTLDARFDAWSRNCPPDLFGDPLWRLPAYRIGRFMAELAREDTDGIRRRDCAHTVEQLLRSVDAIAANITEGYSRFSGRDRARYYEIALGSAREAREWYWRLSNVLGAEEALARGALLTRVVKILNVAIPAEREGASERRILRRVKGR